MLIRYDARPKSDRVFHLTGPQFDERNIGWSWF